VRRGNTRPTAATTRSTGSTLTTLVDANCDPVRFTAPQVRKVRFDGERMILTPPVADVNGVKVTRELTWERISTTSL